MDVKEGKNNNFVVKNNIVNEKKMNSIKDKKENKFDTFSSLNFFNNNYFHEMIPKFHSTDTTPKNNIVINSTTNNHITIINNIINRPKKKNHHHLNQKKVI